MVASRGARYKPVYSAHEFPFVHPLVRPHPPARRLTARGRLIRRDHVVWFSSRLGRHPSLLTDTIDHLLSVPAPTPAAIQLDHAPAPEEPRYSYDIGSINVATSNPQWQSLHLRTAFILTNVALLVFLAVLIELLYFVNLNVQGMVSFVLESKRSFRTCLFFKHKVSRPLLKSNEIAPYHSACRSNF